MGAPRAARVAWAPRAATRVRAERLGVNGARWRFEAMAYLSMVAPLGRVLVAVASTLILRSYGLRPCEQKKEELTTIQEVLRRFSSEAPCTTRVYSSGQRRTW